MRCGLFGKLPAKRDFVCLSTPRDFLRVWEPWLESGMAEGRSQFGPAIWKEAFRSAPIWRFWLGPALCGTAIIGAFMPSVDALGRLFPLTMMAVAGGGEALSPPDIDPRDSWFERAEDILLGALDPRSPFEAIAAALAGLAAFAPEQGRERREPPDDSRLDPDIGEAAGIFAELRRERRECPAGAATFWWTVGGDDCEPLASMQNLMPDPAAFADMLTVRVPHRPKATVQLG